MSISVNQFRANLKNYVDDAIESHEPLVVNRKNGDDFVVLSLEDYNREKETLYVLSDNKLLKQIEDSFTTHEKSQGYIPTAEELQLESDD